ncbi:alpha/beta hydrolase [Streptomyces sp. NPDC046939]|uniref:alpha/beta fold hydrolase n=1 Tax=Streptomyces sp. NPDC046939 TaxID=3155376 RepID=UPI0033C2162C
MTAASARIVRVEFGWNGPDQLASCPARPRLTAPTPICEVDMPTHPARTTIRTIQPQHELDIALVDTGKGTPPVLLLHGGSGPHGVTTLIDHFAPTSRVLAPTHPGWNGTARPAWFTGVDSLASTYLDILEDEVLDDVIVIGTSFGGWVASEMAVRDRGHRISHLVLLDAIGPDIEGHTIAMPRPAPDRGLAESDVQASLAYTGTSMSDPKLLRRLSRVSVPALLIWGQDDMVVPVAFGEKYAAAFPCSRFETIPGAGHMPALQDPDTTFTLIDTFLAET